MTEKIDNLINTATQAVELKSKYQDYQAGVCNIGAGEREKRRELAIFGGMFASAWPFLGFVFVFPIGFKLLVLIPAFIGMLNLLQYRQQFCAYFGLTNQYKFSDTLRPYKVMHEDDRAIDQDKSLKMIAISLAVSFVYTLLVIIFF